MYIFRQRQPSSEFAITSSFAGGDPQPIIIPARLGYSIQLNHVQFSCEQTGIATIVLAIMNAGAAVYRRFVYDNNFETRFAIPYRIGSINTTNITWDGGGADVGQLMTLNVTGSYVKDGSF
jgi:hypothetical protein